MIEAQHLEPLGSQVFRGAGVAAAVLIEAVFLDSEAGIGTLTANDKTYRHFYVLDPSRVNVEIMWRPSASSAKVSPLPARSPVAGLIAAR